MRRTFILRAFVLLAATACADPVQDQQVKALGATDPQGIPDGEFHRAGQPCLTCHGFYGPASLRLAVAGTIFAGPDKAVGVDQITVEFVDSEDIRRSANTNCVGNFFLRADDWDPGFPLKVWLRRGSEPPVKMNTQLSREGSCNQCHKDPPSFDSPGHVHLLGVEPMTPPPPCQYSPVAPIGANR